MFREGCHKTHAGTNLAPHKSSPSLFREQKLLVNFLQNYLRQNKQFSNLDFTCSGQLSTNQSVPLKSHSIYLWIASKLTSPDFLDGRQIGEKPQRRSFRRVHRGRGHLNASPQCKRSFASHWTKNPGFVCLPRRDSLLQTVSTSGPEMAHFTKLNVCFWSSVVVCENVCH